MTNEKKLEEVKKFLKQNRLRFLTEYIIFGKRRCADLYVPKHRILVKITDGKEEDDKFFRDVKYHYHPLFIRDEESVDFVLEKLQNLIIDIMKAKQQIAMNKQSK